MRVVALLVCVSAGLGGFCADWYPGAVHLHTRFSDGVLAPSALAGLVMARGAKFMVVTDHYDMIGKPAKGTTALSIALSGGQPTRLLDLPFGFRNYSSEVSRLSIPGVFAAIPGAEIGARWNPEEGNEASAHTLCIGVIREADTQVLDEYCERPGGQQHIIDKINQWGMLAVAAHPSLLVDGRPGKLSYTGRIDYRYDKRPAAGLPNVDGYLRDIQYRGLGGVEMWDARQENQCEEDVGFFLRLLRDGTKSFVVAGCDYHGYAGYEQSWLDRRTWVYADGLDPDSILKAMANGRTYAAQYGARLVAMGHRPGERITADDARIQATVEFPKAVASAKRFTIYRDGQPAHQSDELPSGSTTYRISWTDDIADGREHSYVLRLGEVLITSPVWITVSPRGGEQHRLGDTKTGPDGGTYVWVPPGEFMMGTPEETGDGYGNERPVHKVRITKGFWLSKHEVTNAQYARFCKATGRTFPKDSNQDDDHPVVWVTWEDAVAYCGHYGLRLPTEAEWEYAARGSNGNRFPWGDGWDPKKCCNGWNRGATDWGRKPGTFPVGSIPTGDSWCCVADMAGNVWEWCADRYKCDYYAESPDSDPTGPGTGDTLVLRGGAWASILAELCRSALRLDDSPQHKLNNLGFRPAMDP